MKRLLLKMEYIWLAIIAFVLYLLFRKQKDVKDYSAILIRIREAEKQVTSFTNFQNYFSNYQRTSFKTEYHGAYKELKSEKGYQHLTKEEKSLIQSFKANYMNIDKLATEYNPVFINKEKNTYKELFDNLEEHPFSDDQRTAIICDEDNNLVIAGAGTGKTTTIAGKVAYLIEKKLASAQEILVISYTKSAVEAMGSRIRQYLNNDEITDLIKVKTFNSYGYEVVRRVNIHQNLALAFEDEQEVFSFLQKQFNYLFLNSEEFSKKAINFLAFFNRPERDEFEFATGDQYHKHEKSFKNMAFDGKKYKSKEEVEIANFLFLNSVQYEYERFFPLELEDKNPAFGSYRPDFFLPEHNAYIEHYGIDENGNVPPFFSGNGVLTATEQYNRGIAWKKEIHLKYGTNLITTYSYENRKGVLIKNLDGKLRNIGVQYRKRTPEEILEVISQQEIYQDFNKLVGTFLSLMKSNKYQPDDVLYKNGNRRLKVFIDVFRPIYERYQEHLRSKHLLDFNDMINQAADAITNNEHGHPFKYILIDEFQDMSLNRYHLLTAMKQQAPAMKIYAVGDDWQSIFRFSGSDISLITQFEKYFGYTKYSQILNTYRFNDEILKVTSGFIQKNDAQLKKDLKSIKLAGQPSFEFFGLSYNGLDNEQRRSLTREKTRAILRELNLLPDKSTVFLIGRYHFNNPKLSNEFENLKIKFYTAHSVKGLTSDYSILLDVNGGTMGFPSEIVDDPILEYLLHEGGHFENAEERRLFYVANTRARHKNFIIYDIYNESKFVKELRADCEILEKTEDNKICRICSGLMVERKGPRGKFYGCTNYPSCQGTLSAKAEIS